MKSEQNIPQIESIIRNSGFVVTRSASIDHPIPIALSYRNNPDGSIRWFWPEGSRCADFSKFYNAGTAAKWTSAFKKICFSLGLGGLIAHGRTVMYADLPTATYILNQWRRD